jgi:hypothetical protein
MTWRWLIGGSAMNSRNIGLVAIGLLASFCFGLPAVTQADQTIYSQPVQSPLVNAGGFQESSGGFINDETFTLSQGASVTSIQWWGSYENGTGTGFPAASATEFDVLLGVCGPDCLTTLSGTLVSGFPMSLSPSMANETFLGTSSSILLDGSIPTASSNYSYQVNLASPVQLSSGEYLISIIPILAPTALDAGWSWDAGTGGDGISQIFGATNPTNFDLAFALNGTPTPMPEPSTLWLVLMGGLGVMGAALVRARLVR